MSRWHALHEPSTVPEPLRIVCIAAPTNDSPAIPGYPVVQPGDGWLVWPTDEPEICTPRTRTNPMNEVRLSNLVNTENALKRIKARLK